MRDSRQSSLTADTKGQHLKSASTNLPDPQKGFSRQQNQSNLSSKFSASHSYHEDEVTISKSLTDLADLPVPLNKKKVQAAAMQWEDDGIEDWNFDDVAE